MAKRYHQAHEDKLINRYVRILNQQDALEAARVQVRDELAQLVKLNPQGARCQVIRISQTKVRGYIRGAYSYLRV